MSYTLLHTRRGSTLVELMIAMAILSLGISALLQTFASGVKYSSDTENNIKAINIAREGIESIMNIRDTNWLRFSSDRTNCWNVMEYESQCIGTPSPSTYSIATGSYIAYSNNGVWSLSGVSSTPSFDTDWEEYKSRFLIGIDSRGFFTQSGVTTNPCSSLEQSNCLSIFSREIQIAYPSTTEMTVRSIARWNLDRPRAVILETTLTNWKRKF